MEEVDITTSYKYTNKLLEFLRKDLFRKYFLLIFWYINTIIIYIIFDYININNWNNNNVDFVGQMFSILDAFIIIFYFFGLIIVISLSILEYKDIDTSIYLWLLYYNMIISTAHVFLIIIYTIIQLFAIGFKVYKDRTNWSDFLFNWILFYIAITDVLLCSWFTDNILRYQKHKNM